jgi:hypothetical protein
MKTQLKSLMENKKLWLFAIGITVIIIAIIAIIVSNNNKIDLSNAYVVTVQGLDTQGEADVQINKENLEAALLSKKIDPFLADSFIDSIKCNLNKAENLKNGDEIVAKIDYNQALASQLKLSFKNTNKKIVVSGLEKGKEIDIFKDIQVDFTGTSPSGSVSIINKSKDPFIENIDFRPSKDEVKNGDKIEIIASYDKNEAIKAKYLVKEYSKEITVTGLPEYLQKASQLTSEHIASLHQHAEKSIQDYISTAAPYFINHIPNRATSELFTLADKYSYKNINDQKAFLITPQKSSDLKYRNNTYCLISSVDLYADNKKVGTTYILSEIKGIIINHGKIESESSSSQQVDTLEEAENIVEGSYKDFNLEQVAIK